MFKRILCFMLTGPGKVSGQMLEDADLVVTVCGHANEHGPVLPAGTNIEQRVKNVQARCSNISENTVPQE